MAVEIPTFSASRGLPLVRQPRLDPNVAAAPGRALQQLGGVAQAVAVDAGNRAIAVEEAKQRARNAADMARAGNDATRALGELGLGLEQDPDFRSHGDRFAEGAADIKSRVAETIADDETRNRFALDFDDLADAKSLGVRRNAFRREVDSTVADLDAATGDFARAASTAASDVERTEIMRQGSGAIDAMAAAGFITARDAVARKTRFGSNVDEARIRGLIARDPSAAVAALDDNEQFAALAPERRSILADMAQRRQAAAESRRQAALNKQRSAVAAEIREIRGITRNGLDPGPERFERLRGRIDALGDPALARELANAERSQVLQEQLRVQTPADLQNFVNGERTRLAGKQGVTAAESERLGMAERLLATMRTETARDPLAWANRVGLIEIAPVTFAGDDAIATMQNRVADARAVAARYGVTPRFLTDEEATQLKAAMRALDPDGQLAMVATVAKGFGRDAPKVLGEFAKSAPVLAHAGGLALQSQAHLGVARDILIGARALADNKDLLPGALDQADWTDDVLGTAVGELPETRSAIVESARALYARGALQRGLTNAAPDQDLWNASVQAAAGGVTDRDGERWGGVGEWNGGQVLIPTDMRADQFEARIAALDDADLARFSVGGEPARDIKGRVLRADQLDDVWLVSAGVGRYLVSSTDPRAGPPQFFQGSGDAGVYILDLDLAAGDDTADGAPAISPPPAAAPDFSGAAP